MAAAKKPIVATKATTTKPKAPPAKKFGEVGYRFPVMAEIVEVNPENDDEFAFVIGLDLNQWEDYESNNLGKGMTLSYATKKDLVTDMSKHDKKVAKQLKAEEIKVAEAVVAKLKKELEAL